MKFFEYFKQDEKLFDEASRVEGMIFETLLPQEEALRSLIASFLLSAIVNCSPRTTIRHMLYGPSCLRPNAQHFWHG